MTIRMWQTSWLWYNFCCILVLILLSNCCFFSVHSSFKYCLVSILFYGHFLFNPIFCACSSATKDRIVCLTNNASCIFVSASELLETNHSVEMDSLNQWDLIPCNLFRIIMWTTKISVGRNQLKSKAVSNTFRIWLDRESTTLIFSDYPTAQALRAVDPSPFSCSTNLNSRGSSESLHWQDMPTSMI